MTIRPGERILTGAPSRVRDYDGCDPLDHLKLQRECARLASSAMKRIARCAIPVNDEDGITQLLAPQSCRCASCETSPTPSCPSACTRDALAFCTIQRIGRRASERRLSATISRRWRIENAAPFGDGQTIPGMQKCSVICSCWGIA